MSLHTPGPYVLWDDGRTIGIESADVDEKGETFPIAVWEVVDYGDMAAPEQLAADQAFAFRAITCHYRLISALSGLLPYVAGGSSGDHAGRPWLSNAVAVLNVAKGQ